MEHNIVSSLKPELQYGTCYLEIALFESVVARCWVLKDRVTGSSRPVFSFWACLGAETDWTIQVSEPAAFVARPDLWDGTDRTLRTT